MKKLLLPLLVGLIVFFGLDALVFRSGLYNRELSPMSIGGAGYYEHYFEKRRASDNQHDVLLTGDSRMGEGFSVRQANMDPEADGLHFVQAAIPGSTLRVWYYLLKDMDPQANRYRAIVLTVPSYRRIPDQSDLQNRPLDADILEPIISTRDFLDLASTYPALPVRQQMWFRALVAGSNYRMDLQDFLLHPKTRLKTVKWRRSAGGNVALDYDGHPESMVGLAMDAQTRALSYPTRLTPDERAAVDRRLQIATQGPTDALDDYNAYWIAKICDRYAQGHTTIVIVRVPTSPLPSAFAQEESLPKAHFLDSVLGRPHVVALPEGTFQNLETPDNFFDTNHLNHTGRTAFTSQLVRALPNLLTKRSPAEAGPLTAMEPSAH